MRSVAARATKSVVLDEVPRPDPGPGDVLVAVRSCGICGSDLHWWHGEMPAPGVCPGHEIAGIVAATGRNVTRVKEGDRVALEGMASCGECRACLAGDYHVCPRIGFLGMTVPGGFADYLVLPARHAFPIPKGVDFPTAALSEPLAVAVHGVRIAGLAIGQRVAVLGAGTIGLMAIVAARAGGAGEVVATARRPQQKAAALALGADRVVDPDDLDGLTGDALEQPIDLVVETVGGAADTLQTAAMACRPGGTICLLGVYTQAPVFPAVFAVVKELRIMGSIVYNRAGARADFEIVQDILAREGESIGRKVVTHRFPLSAIGEAFETAADKTTGSIKVSITVSE
jgi:2-desacetyl-2-hydroxyethyl bacteriochlorophyllide A dehydrogenase